MNSRQRFLVRGTLVAFAALGLVAGLVVLGVVPPTANTWYPKCASYTLAGVHCPGCGLTRAVHAALNGRFGEALSQNVLVFVAVPYLLFGFLSGLWHYFWQTPPRPPRFRYPKWVTVTLVALLVAFTIARNIPTYPFNLLAPKELPVAPADDTPPTDPTP